MFSFEQSKLDLDLGYVANDRSEFEDSGGFTNEIKRHSIQPKYTKMGKIETIVGVQGMHQTNVNSGRIFDSDAVTNDFGVWNRKL
jgi:iron complex outermembrane receptor protein